VNSPFSSVARWWRNRGIVRANLERARKCEAPVVQSMVHTLGVAPPELRALAGKWPDAALKRRLAAFAPDPDDSISNVIALDALVTERKLAKGAN
jgi:hypothetical protein